MPLNCSYGFASFGATKNLPARISVIPSTTSTTEGGTVNFTVVTQNLPSPLTYYWTVSGLKGTVDSTDFSTDAWGTYDDTNNTAVSGNVTLALGHQTGTNKTFYYAIKAYSTTSRTISTSTAITIISPLYTSVTVNNTLMYEGQGTSTFTVNTSGCVDGTVLYYTARATIGSISGSTFNSGVTYGSFTVTSNVGTFSLASAYEDGNNTDDTYVVDIRADSTSGPVVKTSPTVKMVDLSNYNTLYTAYSNELTNKFGGKGIGVTLFAQPGGVITTATFLGAVLTANPGGNATSSAVGAGGTASGGDVNVTGGVGIQNGIASGGTSSGGSGGSAGGNNTGGFGGTSWPDGLDTNGLFAALSALGYVTVSTSYVAPNVQNILKGGRGGNNTQNVTSEGGFNGTIGGGGGGGGTTGKTGGSLTFGGAGGGPAVVFQYTTNGTVTGRVIRTPGVGFNDGFLETIPNGVNVVRVWIIARGGGGYQGNNVTFVGGKGGGGGGISSKTWTWTAPTAPTKPALA
jgi:hypothetical protein